MPAFDPSAIIAAGPTNTGPNDQLPEKIAPTPDGDKTFDFDAFETIKTGNKVTKEEVIKDPPKPDEKVEDDKKKVDETLQKEEEEALKRQEEKEKLAKENEEEAPKPPPTAKLPKKEETESKGVEIDFKDLVPETAIPLLKKASKETQEFILAELKRNKTALEAAKAEAETAKKSVREGLPNAWYEHENAYQLTPEFQAAATKASSLQNYADHFRQQLIAIEEGEKWVDLIVGADGKVQQVPREPGAAAKVNVMERINAFTNAIAREQQIAGQIAHNFKQQAINLRGDMKKTEDEFFPQYKEGFDKNEHGQYVLKVLASKGQANNPIAGFLAKLYATFIEDNTELEKYRAKENKVKKIAAVDNGPTGGEIDKGEKVEGKKNIEDMPFDPDAFLQVKNRGMFV